MYQEVRLHGHIDDTIEYFATAAARDAYRCYFYETQGDSLRFFSPGNEFIIDKEGVNHRGNGGSFCEYMFGVSESISLSPIWPKAMSATGWCSMVQPMKRGKMPSPSPTGLTAPSPTSGFFLKGTPYITTTFL
jgi:hypothetical protein